MGKHKRIPNEDFVKAYYAALREGLVLSQFADKIGMSPWGVRVKIKTLKAAGMDLPDLKIAGPGFRKGGPKKPHRLIKDPSPVPAPSPNRKFITAEDLIRIWQTSESFNEVSEKTGLSQATLKDKIKRLRKLGLNKLKKFSPKGFRLDIAKLNALAESLLPKEPSNG